MTLLTVISKSIVRVATLMRPIEVSLVLFEQWFHIDDLKKFYNQFTSSLIDRILYLLSVCYVTLCL